MLLKKRGEIRSCVRLGVGRGCKSGRFLEKQFFKKNYLIEIPGQSYSQFDDISIKDQSRVSSYPQPVPTSNFRVIFQQHEQEPLRFCVLLRRPPYSLCKTGGEGEAKAAKLLNETFPARLFGCGFWDVLHAFGVEALFQRLVMDAVLKRGFFADLPLFYQVKQALVHGAHA